MYHAPLYLKKGTHFKACVVYLKQQIQNFYSLQIKINIFHKY